MTRVIVTETTRTWRLGIGRDPNPGAFVERGLGLFNVRSANSSPLTRRRWEHDWMLAIRFGPLPLFHQRIRYDAIRDVEIGRTMLIEGWGIHMSMLRPGMVWNIWGRDCVVIHHHSTLRLGTNDAENLYAFLKTKIA